MEAKTVAVSMKITPLEADGAPHSARYADLNTTLRYADGLELEEQVVLAAMRLAEVWWMVQKAMEEA